MIMKSVWRMEGESDYLNIESEKNICLFEQEKDDRIKEFLDLLSPCTVQLTWIIYASGMNVSHTCVLCCEVPTHSHRESLHNGGRRCRF